MTVNRSVKLCLKKAIGQPALPTLLNIPSIGGIRKRVARLLNKKAIEEHTATEAHNATHPSKEALRKAIVAGRWLWIMPTLLLRHHDQPEISDKG